MKNKFIISLVFFMFSMGGCNTKPDLPEIIQPTLSPDELAGKQIFIQNCSSCHATDSELVIVGPSLVGIASRAGTNSENESPQQFIELSILKPASVITEGFDDLMPKTFGKTLTSEEFNSLISFLLTLK